MRYVLIILIFFPAILSAQDSNRIKMARFYNSLEPIISDTCPIYSEPALILKTSLLSPFQKNRIAKLAIEVPVYNAVSAQLSAGYMFDIADNTYKLNHNKGNYEFGLDLKYYFALITVIRLYTGPNVTYRQINADVGKFITNTTLDAQGRPIVKRVLDMQNPAIVKNEQTNFMWQAGVQPFLSNHFALDIYAAFGAAHIKNSSQVSFSEKAEITKEWKPTTMIGVNIGYAF